MSLTDVLKSLQNELAKVDSINERRVRSGERYASFLVLKHKAIRIKNGRQQEPRESASAY